VKPVGQGEASQRTLDRSRHHLYSRLVAKSSGRAKAHAAVIQQAVASFDDRVRDVRAVRSPKRTRSESSDSTSDEEEGGREVIALRGSRSQVLKRRSKRRIEKYLDATFDNRPESVSLLEKESVTRRVQEYYQDELDQFNVWKKDESQEKPSLTDGDALLTAYFNFLFFAGHMAPKGMKVLAAFMFFHPEYAKAGHLGLPRAWRALKGWKRLCPSQTRVPYPWAFWCGMANQMTSRGFLNMGIFTLVAVGTYLRPCQLLSLTVASLVAPMTGATSTWSLLVHPQEKPGRSKVGEADVSILLDGPMLQWMSPVFAEIRRNRLPSEPLFDFDYPAFLKIFHQCADVLAAKVTPYQTRHSGPSIDRASKFRLLDAVRQRGQWQHMKSVNRYEKHARLAKSMESLPRGVQVHLRECERQIRDVILRGAVVTLPQNARA